MKTKKQRIATATYDLRGHGIGRVFKQQVLEKCLPFGQFGGGAHILWVVRLMVLHRVGHLVAWFWVRRRRYGV